MDCERHMIYFSVYESGRKVRSAGYMAVFIRGEVCDIQLYYRGKEWEEGLLEPVYMFRDGTVCLGEKAEVREGMAATAFRTGRRDFVQSGRSFEELEVIYLDGETEGICGGRTDGKELEEPVQILSEQEESEERKEELPERWSLATCLEQFPEVKLPYDGIRRKCCRIDLTDLEHLPPEWEHLKGNHFLLHGYYEYHHLIFVKLACRYGERFALGVPGEFCYRSRNTAETFGFYDFAPLEPGRRRGGCFGYWYYYLENK